MEITQEQLQGESLRIIGELLVSNTLLTRRVQELETALAEATTPSADDPPGALRE